MSLNKRTVAKLIALKLGAEPEFAEIVAEDMIHDDFPMSGVKTMGQVIAYLDWFADVRAGRVQP